MDVYWDAVRTSNYVLLKRSGDAWVAVEGQEYRVVREEYARRESQDDAIVALLREAEARLGPPAIPADPDATPK